MSAAAVRIASAGLDPDAAAVDIDSAGWTAVRHHVQQDRLVGLAAAAQRAGTLRLDDRGAEELEALDEQWQSSALVLERTMLNVVSALESADFDVRVLKGPAWAHTVYRQPSWRVFGDIDLLVRGEQLADVRRFLVDRCHAEDPLPELRPGFDAEFGKDVLIRLDGLELDLHRTLAAGPFGLRIPVAELFEDPTPVELAGSRFATLPPLLTFLHACYNAALGDVPPRLLSLRDVAQVHGAHDLDPVAVVERAEAWGGAAVVAHAVQTTWRTFDLAACDLSAWAAAHRPSRLDRHLLAASVSPRRSYTRHLAALATVPGLGAKRRYATAVLFPSAEYLDARNWTRQSHVGRALRRLTPDR